MRSISNAMWPPMWTRTAARRRVLLGLGDEVVELMQRSSRLQSTNDRAPAGALDRKRGGHEGVRRAQHRLAGDAREVERGQRAARPAAEGNGAEPVVGRPGVLEPPRSSAPPTSARRRSRRPRARGGGQVAVGRSRSRSWCGLDRPPRRAPILGSVGPMRSTGDAEQQAELARLGDERPVVRPHLAVLLEEAVADQRWRNRPSSSESEIGSGTLKWTVRSIVGAGASSVSLGHGAGNQASASTAIAGASSGRRSRRPSQPPTSPRSAPRERRLPEAVLHRRLRWTNAGGWSRGERRPGRWPRVVGRLDLGHRPARSSSGPSHGFE